MEPAKPAKQWETFTTQIASPAVPVVSKMPFYYYVPNWLAGRDTTSPDAGPGWTLSNWKLHKTQVEYIVPHILTTLKVDRQSGIRFFRDDCTKDAKNVFVLKLREKGHL